jgi:hypothetical protein
MAKLIAGVAVSIALLSGSVGAEPAAQASQAQATAQLQTSPVAGVPVDALPSLGECRIWYDGLPVERQPASMECQHAHWLARSWGGRVIGHDSQQGVYVGRNDFTGVPASQLPRRGWCRAWVDGAAMQPAESDCLVARRTAAELGGRVLFMPL